MSTIRLSLLALSFTLLIAGCNVSDTVVPLILHPENPHYFMFRGKPAILIGSTEHYGAVMNLDFDYVKYFDELAASGLNITRTFTGVYVEPEGAFGIKRNTLAPAPERFICPWARSSEAGYANGGNKFNLSEWDEAYFLRLKDFIKEAGKRNIVVELDLFSNFYDTIQWKLSPLYHKNNINGIGRLEDHKEVLSLRHPEMIDVQEKMVRKIITELKDFDNLYYEMCNEPYFGDTIALRQWEDHMTGVVAESERSFRYKHLISNNIANRKKLVPELRDNVSIYNFHYAKPPLTVAMNYHLGRVIGDNETGFNGIEDETYRIEAWNFILAGGGLFNHLDYSFAAGHEDGSFIIEEGQPGGGGRTLRNQFRILAEFMQSLNYIDMKPVSDEVKWSSDPNLRSVYGLTGKDGSMALYLNSNNTEAGISGLDVNLPPGSYNLAWFDTKDGSVTHAYINGHIGGWVTVNSPVYSIDIAVKIERKE